MRIETPDFGPGDVLEGWMAGALAPSGRHEDGASTTLLLRSVPRSDHHRRGLSPREREVVRAVCLGYPMKIVGSNLAISTPSAGAYLTEARRKMAFASRAELVFWGSRLLSSSWEDARATASYDDGSVALHASLSSPDPATLSPAERAVAVLVARGLSNEDIARARGVSPRTIANQLASVFRKITVGSRFELAARVGH